MGHSLQLHRVGRGHRHTARPPAAAAGPGHRREDRARRGEPGRDLARGGPGRRLQGAVEVRQRGLRPQPASRHRRQRDQPRYELHHHRAHPRHFVHPAGHRHPGRQGRRPALRRSLRHAAPPAAGPGHRREGRARRGEPGRDLACGGPGRRLQGAVEVRQRGLRPQPGSRHRRQRCQPRHELHHHRAHPRHFVHPAGHRHPGRQGRRPALRRSLRHAAPPRRWARSPA